MSIELLINEEFQNGQKVFFWALYINNSGVCFGRMLATESDAIRDARNFVYNFNYPICMTVVDDKIKIIEPKNQIDHDVNEFLTLIRKGKTVDVVEKKEKAKKEKGHLILLKDFE